MNSQVDGWKLNTELLKTPLYDWHVAHGGRMVDFAGWSMPVQYTSIIEEHSATRNAATLFDVSHMGRFELQGAGTAQFLDRLTTRRVENTPVGKIRYTLICNDEGGILDDVLVYRIDNPEEAESFAIVVNASNRQKIANWIELQLRAATDGADKTVRSSIGRLKRQ